MNKIIYRVAYLATIALFVSNTAMAQGNVVADTSGYIPWRPIKESDILWKKRVWRQIDVYEKNNAAFRMAPGIPSENLFANILLKGIANGVFNAYADNDTSFIKPLPVDTVIASTICNPVELSGSINYRAKHLNDASAVASSEVRSCVYPEQVEYYGIKEDWIFDRAEGVLVVHIAAIAPIVMEHGQMKMLFWVKYPDIKKYIAKYEVYDGKKDTISWYTWDEYFESRQFSSKITYVAVRPEEIEYIKEKRSHKHKKHKSDGQIKHDGQIFDTDRDMWIY